MGADYPYQPKAVLKQNPENLKKELKKDKELSQHIDKFLYKNADNLFNKNK